MTFPSRQEAEALYNVLQKDRALFHVKLDGVYVFIEGAKSGLTTHTRERLSELLTQFIIGYYEDRWLTDIIKKTFYFEDEEEQASILDIIHAILSGEKTDLPNVERLPAREELIKTSITDLLKGPATFSFESIETFRLNRYHQWLLRVTELAIDEYKLQQEYVAFIEKLRRIVQDYRPLHNTIYIKDGDPFELYDENLRPIKNVQSIRSFYPLLKQWGIDPKPSIVLSLIGLSPEKIHIYTERETCDEMMTLQKVFEERVSFHPKAAFKDIELKHHF
ncbi:MAG TPA: putative sporulation protein YtxC [Sporolactobacillaceae bacterium]|nr:putative sporulation protein YtxC [Sporolactobacillaceae bacterium]